MNYYQLSNGTGLSREVSAENIQDIKELYPNAKKVMEFVPTEFPGIYEESKTYLLTPQA